MAEIHMIYAGPNYQDFKKWAMTRKYEFNAERKGYNRPFLYEPTYCIVKLKKECVPEFLADLKASTSELSDDSGKHVKGMVNLTQKVIDFAIDIHNFVRCRLMGKKQYTKINKVNMSKIGMGKDTFPGWSYSKVLFVQNDDINRRGQEEL